MAVFFSFPFFQGKLKIYYLPLAIVIASAMAASLLVSFTLDPGPQPAACRKAANGRNGRRDRSPRFEKALGVLIRHPVEVLLVVAALLFGAYKWFRAEVTLGRWYPWYSKEYLYVRVGMPPGTDIARTDETIRAFEEKVLAQDFEKEMNVRIVPENAQAIIGFPPEIEKSYRPYALKEELIQLATQFAGIDISVSGFDPQSYASSMGAGTYYSSRIKFFGYNLRKLKEITGDLEKTLRRNPRIKEVRTVSSRYGWWRGDTVEDILKIDKAALKRYDVDPAYLYFALQTMIQGTFGQPARIRTEGKDIAVSVKSPDAAALDMRGLRESLIMTRGGEYLRIGEIAAFTEAPIPGSIDRENQQFQQTIMWEFRGPSKAEERYRKGIYDSLHLAARLLGDARRAVVRDREGAEADQLRHRRRPGHHLHDPGGALRVVRPALLHPAGRAALAHRRLRRLRRGQGALRPDGLHRRHPAFGHRRQQRHPARRSHQRQAQAGAGPPRGRRPRHAGPGPAHLHDHGHDGLRHAAAAPHRGGGQQTADLVVAGPVHGRRPDHARRCSSWSSSPSSTIHGDGLRAWGAEKAREARELFGKRPG